MIVDVNAVSFDTGITSFPNRRTDTRLDGRPLDAGGTLRVNVPEAVGSQDRDRPADVGPRHRTRIRDRLRMRRRAPSRRRRRGRRSDLNYDGRVTPQRSNRLIVEADADGDVCFYTLRSVHLVIDVNGVSDAGITSFDNRRTDTRSGGADRCAAGAVFRVNVPEAVGSKTVVGQLTAAQVSAPGYVTAFGCDDGLPRDDAGAVVRSDLNYDPRICELPLEPADRRSRRRRRRVLLHPAERPPGDRRERRVRRRDHLVREPANRHPLRHRARVTRACRSTRTVSPSGRRTPRSRRPSASPR